MIRTIAQFIMMTTLVVGGSVTARADGAAPDALAPDALAPPVVADPSSAAPADPTDEVKPAPPKRSESDAPPDRIDDVADAKDPARDPKTPSTAKPSTREDSANASAPAGALPAADDVSVGWGPIATGASQVAVGTVVFVVVMWVLGIVSSPLNAAGGLGMCLSVLGAGFASSYAQAFVGDFLGQQRGTVLPSAIGTWLSTMGCGVLGVVGATVGLYVGMIAAIFFGVGILSGGIPLDPTMGRGLGGLGGIGVILGLYAGVIAAIVVAYGGAILGALLTGQTVGAVVYAVMGEYKEEGDTGQLAVPGFMKPNHPKKRATRSLDDDGAHFDNDGADSKDDDDGENDPDVDDDESRGDADDVACPY